MCGGLYDLQRLVEPLPLYSPGESGSWIESLSLCSFFVLMFDRTTFRSCVYVLNLVYNRLGVGSFSPVNAVRVSTDTGLWACLFLSQS